LRARPKLWIGLCLGGLLLILLAAAAAIGIFLHTNLAQQWMRDEVVRQIEQRTGTRVEIGKFHANIWGLRAEIQDLTAHGLEPASQPPLFHADRIDVGLRILSLFRKQIALEELIVEHPQVFVRIEKNGTSNVPSPKRPAGNRDWRQTLFSLRIGRLELRDGDAAFNDRRVPLDLHGRDLAFDLHYVAPLAAPDSYIGNLSWRQVEFAEKRNLPFRFDLATRFTLHRDSFEIDDLVCKLPHSEFDLRAELASFAHPNWDLHYRGRLSLADVRRIFRAPTTPDALADFSGEAHYASGAGDSGQWTGSGHYNGHDIRMPYQWFHASGLQTWGDYQIANTLLAVPNLQARALGGNLDGTLTMDFRTLAFRTQTRLRGMSLAAALNAVNNPNLPVNPLHWDGALDVDSVNTWDSKFKHFESAGQTRWSPPATLEAGKIPVTASIDYDYAMRRKAVTISDGEITTPQMQLQMDGFLGAADSALEVKFRAGDLGQWDDFITAIRGPNAPPRAITGKVSWNGRILGPLVGPVFIGQMHATEARYDKLYWDDIAGEMEYSPDDFHLTKTTVRRGATSADIDLALEFDKDWDFAPESTWSLTARMEHAPSDDLQAIFSTHYPFRGFLTGSVHGGGTRAQPELDSNFTFDDIEAGKFRFDELTAQLHAETNVIHLSHAELRKGAESVSGDVLYHPREKDAVFDVTGTRVSLENIPEIQTASLPIGGKLSFTLRGNGPLRAPIGEATLRVVDLKLGAEVQGNFNGELSSDGQSAHLTLASDIAHGKLAGDVSMSLSENKTISGRLTVEQFDLDPLIAAGLHLQHLTGHSSADGIFTISGAARDLDAIELNADITRISFDYELVQLANDQDIKVAYRRNEVRIGQAHIHGPDTDFRLEGSARFDRDRPLRFTLSGGVNLQLVKGLLPDLQARGRAEANISVEGTMSRPRVTGRATVRDASATYGDFPIGLSKLNGDLLFDKTRLVFDRMSAESGGGHLLLSGSMTYGEGPLRYDVSAATSVVRVRYPAGMSWLVGGTIQLAGTRTAALVSGHVQVQRLLFASGVDLTSFFASSSETETAPSTASPFLQNLVFDVEGQTAVGARIEWSGAQVEMDGNVRLRGTWDRPVLLGHIHLLGGQMPFRGNTYQLTRGEINFSNPFRLDPILNVEATSTISQYQVTIDFSGPASHLTLNYRSDPPLPDSDIIALLALGSPGESSGLRSASTSQNYGATALLSEAISSGLGGRIERLFGVSQFRVDPFVAGTATESNAAARITIEQQVKNKITITYSTNAATSNQYQLIQVEYAVKRDLSVVFLRDINGTNGLDIKWVKHFK
jgi:translocation and assembly module TamB